MIKKNLYVFYFNRIILVIFNSIFNHHYIEKTKIMHILFNNNFHNLINCLFFYNLFMIYFPNYYLFNAAYYL